MRSTRLPPFLVLDATFVDPVHEQLEVLRSLLKQAKETATGIQGIAADINAGACPQSD